MNKEILYDSYKFNCNSSKYIKVFILKRTCKSEMNYNIHSDLVSGQFDYLFPSMCLVPSADQPGYSECAHAGIVKQTSNPKILSLINEACKEIGF